MKIYELIEVLEDFAPLPLQEHYDNAGLITGDRNSVCTGILCCLDSTEEVIEEAISQGANMVIAHHPILFSGLKRLTGSSYIERAILKAIKHDIAIYAIHTNLDNLLPGVNSRIADKIGITDRRILSPREDILMKLVVFIPTDHVEKVRSSIFLVGGGTIGKYSECSFTVSGMGTFKPGEGTKPFVGKDGERHQEPEDRVEIIAPRYLKDAVIKAIRASHPYEEPAFDIIPIINHHEEIGSGLVGSLSEPLSPDDFLRLLQTKFSVPAIRYTSFPGDFIKRVAICGGSGSFLISKALSAKADAFVTADVKYHQFFDSEGKLMICDIGHFESEQFTIDLLYELLVKKFPTFAVLKTTLNTNPVKYFVG